MMKWLFKIASVLIVLAICFVLFQLFLHKLKARTIELKEAAKKPQEKNHKNFNENP